VKLLAAMQNSLPSGSRDSRGIWPELAKRPELPLLDEPVAALDPLPRREFLRGLMEAVAAHGTSVVMSSHLVADLERVRDYLVVLVASRVRVAPPARIVTRSRGDRSARTAAR
jgi:ABC-2 type transport system ATP-binding protein